MKTTERRTIKAPLYVDDDGRLCGHAVRFGTFDHGAWSETYAPTSTTKTFREAKPTLTFNGQDIGSVRLAQAGDGLRFSVPVDEDVAALVRHGSLDVVATVRVIREEWAGVLRAIREVALVGLELASEPQQITTPKHLPSSDPFRALDDEHDELAERLARL